VGRKRAAGNERLGEHVQRRSNGNLELRFPIPPDVQGAFLDNGGLPKRVLTKSLGTTDTRLANAKAEALKTDIRKQILAVREAARSDGLGDFLQTLHEAQIAQTYEDLAKQKRLKLRAASKRSSAGSEDHVRDPEWTSAIRQAYGAALVSDDPEERRAVAGWAADQYFKSRGQLPPKDSPEYRAVIDRSAEALADTVVAQNAIADGKALAQPTSTLIRAATSQIQRLSPPTPLNPAPSANGQLLLSRYFEEVYVQQSAAGRGQAHGERNIPGKRHSVRLFCELVGDKPVGGISKVDFYSFVALLARLPDKRSLTGPLKDARADEIIKQVEASGMKLQLLHPNTVNKHSSNLSAVLSFAERRLEIAPAQVQGVKIKVEDPEPPGRAFTNKELNRIFAQPLFTGCAGEDVEAGLFKPGPVKIRDDRFWIPLVLLFTGARSSEAVGLLTSEVEIDHAIPHFVLQPNTIRRLKNTHSKRLIPIHLKLIELGFLAFVKARRKDRGNPQLFPMAVQTAYRDGATGDQVARAISNSLIMRQFNRTILDHADARRDRGSIKCFRNTFEQESLSKLDSDELRQRLTGRKVVSSGRIYTTNQPSDPDQRNELLEKLKREIDKITYSSLDLKGLG